MTKRHPSQFDRRLCQDEGLRSLGDDGGSAVERGDDGIGPRRVVRDGAPQCARNAVHSLLHVERGIRCRFAQHAVLEVDVVHFRPEQQVIDLVVNRPAARVERRKPRLELRELLLLCAHDSRVIGNTIAGLCRPPRARTKHRTAEPPELIRQ
jgi:hypothetical protein